MTIEYSMNIDSMSCYPTYEDKKDFVYNVLWTMSATDGVFNSTQHCKTEIAYNPDDHYIAYPDLTPEEVMDWVNKNAGAQFMDATRAYLAKAIDYQKPSETTSPPLPWNP